MTAALDIQYFSDVLCVWAYAGQVRVDELHTQFGPQICIADHFLNVYGDVPRRIIKHAGDSDAPQAAYAAKMRGVAERFEHTEMHEDCFTKVVPKSSNQAHLLLCAVRKLVHDGTADPSRLPTLVRAVRTAFFEQARDVAQHGVLFELLEEHDVPRAPVEARLADGSAMAELSQDMMQKDEHRIVGSPTYVLDGGRQKLFGNVGYRVIEANVTELLDTEKQQRGASWC